MAIEIPPYVDIDPSYKQMALFHHLNKTYDITNLCSGPIFDLFSSMMNYLNASYSLYRRNDSVFGVYENGKWTGMLHNLVDGEADIIVSLLFRFLH